MEKGRRIGVLSSEELFCGLDEGDLGAEALKALGEFAADGPAAENDESLGAFLKVKDVFISEEVDLIEPGNRRNECTGARRDDGFAELQ